MVTTTRRPNADTLVRWDAALKRAYGKGLRLFQHDATGQWFCSGSDGQTVYAVGHFTCECAAALANDPVCQHRALYREACRVDDQEVEAILTGPNTDDTALTFDQAAAMEGATVLSIAAGSRTIETLPARTRCTDCLDTGTARMYTGGRHNAWVPVNCGCRRRAA